VIIHHGSFAVFENESNCGLLLVGSENFPVNYLRRKINLRTCIRISEQPFTIKAGMPSSPAHFGGCRRLKKAT
jgi:hypothetical protein